MARPTDFTQRQRAARFWAELALSGSFEEAQAASGIAVGQLTRILDSPEAIEACVRLTRSCTRAAAREMLDEVAA